MLGFIAGLSFFASIALAAPIVRLERTILPETNSLYDLGTSTQSWRDVFLNSLCLSSIC